MQHLESDKEALLRSYAAMTPAALDTLTSEERHQVYKMLRLKVMVHLDGALEVSGALSDCFANENEDERLAVAQDQVDLPVACAVIALRDLVTFADEISQREPLPQEAGLTTTQTGRTPA